MYASSIYVSSNLVRVKRTPFARPGICAAFLIALTNLSFGLTTEISCNDMDKGPRERVEHTLYVSVRTGRATLIYKWGWQ